MIVMMAAAASIVRLRLWPRFMAEAALTLRLRRGRVAGCEIVPPVRPALIKVVLTEAASVEAAPFESAPGGRPVVEAAMEAMVAVEIQAQRRADAPRMPPGGTRS